MGMVPEPQNGSSSGADCVPAGGHQQRRRQGLAQGRFGHRQPVAAFVQQFPGRVHADGALVIHQPHDDQLRRMAVGFFIRCDQRAGLPQPFLQPGHYGARHGIRVV